jgi:hypothetical protein
VSAAIFHRIIANEWQVEMEMASKQFSFAVVETKASGKPSIGCLGEKYFDFDSRLFDAMLHSTANRLVLLWLRLICHS